MWSVRALSMLALLSVLALLATSDFSDPYVASVSEIVPGSESVRMVCTLESMKQGQNGLTVVLRDGQGQPVRGYMAEGTMDATLGPGALVEVTADLSWDDGLFLFIRNMRPLRA
jgi:hypothetical protein